MKGLDVWTNTLKNKYQQKMYEEQYDENADKFRFLGKLPTYPSLKPTFCPKWEVSDNVGLGER